MEVPLVLAAVGKASLLGAAAMAAAPDALDAAPAVTEAVSGAAGPVNTYTAQDESVLQAIKGIWPAMEVDASALREVLQQSQQAMSSVMERLTSSVTPDAVTPDVGSAGAAAVQG